MVKKEMSETKSKKLVGFFPHFFNLAETGRAVMIAKRYREMGGKTIFFSHGGKYEFLAEKNGFEIERVKPFVTDELVKEWFKFLSLETLSAKNLLGKDWILKNVREEIKAFKKTKIDLLLTTNNVTCAIPARVLNIPYVNVTASGGSFVLKIPDALENPFTRLIPQKIKTKFLNFIMDRANWYIRPINRVAKKVGAPTFKDLTDLFRGDYTFVTDNLEFINVFPNQQYFKDDEYIGIILLDELFEENISEKKAKEINNKIDKHLKKTGKSIMLSLGSSGTPDFFKKILNVLSNTEYNVIAVYTSILKEDELPEVGENILLIKFVPSIRKLNSMVDLAIIHGGQGTVYNAIYSKKPIIGFPMIYEQNMNLEKIVGHGSGIMLSKKFFSKEKLIDSINEIFSNYEKYKTNAEKLAAKIPPPKGDKKIAEKIYEIVNK